VSRSSSSSTYIGIASTATVIPCRRRRVVVALVICITSLLSLCWRGTGRLHHVVVVVSLWHLPWESRLRLAAMDVPPLSSSSCRCRCSDSCHAGVGTGAGAVVMWVMTLVLDRRRVGDGHGRGRADACTGVVVAG